MIYAVGLLSVFSFLVALERFGAARVAARVLETSRAGASSIRDHSLTDSEKEHALREASVALIGDLASIGARSLGAVGVSMLPMLGADLVGLAEFSGVTSWLATWEAIVLITVLVGGWYGVKRVS